jgi:tetratricopeptide (TPR) repeat protein
MTDERLTRAQELYERATFGGDASVLAEADAALDAVEADLALARGRILHARALGGGDPGPAEGTLFERAAELYNRLDDAAGEADALFWFGIYHQVVRRDSDTARPSLQRSYDLARRTDERLTLSYAARHLAFDAMEREDLATARDLFEESLRLRRELDFGPGVAAALLALAELSAADGDAAGAERLLDEADTVAQASEAHGVRHWIAQARTELASAARPDV